jgi:hypothetical protein
MSLRLVTRRSGRNTLLTLSILFRENLHVCPVDHPVPIAKGPLARP